jgi:hypothetical protein
VKVESLIFTTTVSGVVAFTSLKIAPVPENEEMFVNVHPTISILDVPLM